MKNKPVVISLIICIIIAAAGLTYQFAMFGKKDEIHIDCLGDSITWGMFSSRELEEAIENGDIYVGLDDGGQLFEDVNIYISSARQSDPSYPEVLESDLNRKLSADGSKLTVVTYNDGICGDWITKESYLRMSCDNPDIVVLLMGGNNYYFDLPIDGMFEANIKALKARGATIYLANYPLFPGEKHVGEFASANEHIAQMAEKFDLPLIDLYAEFEELVEEGTDRKDLFSLDRIHLSEKAYELVGHYVADAIYRDIAEK